MSRPRAPTAEHVTVVSGNRATRADLEVYLRAAGVSARSTGELVRCAEGAPARTRAFVVFPDDFHWEEVVATLAELTERYPAALPVLVTAQPQRYEGLSTPRQFLIVARPVWGWVILDAIRAHHITNSSSEKQ